jgi:1,3-beta-glucan synthase
MAYQAPPGPKHTTSSYSSASSDPFNPSVQQLPYGDTPVNPYAPHGAPNPGAGGAGVAPPTASGQYAPMYDTESEMAHRYDGGGVGRETYMSDAGWSQSGELD